MSIFGAIRNAIFGTAEAAPATNTGGGANVGAGQGVGWTVAPGQTPAEAQSTNASATAAAPAQPVDVEAVLREKSAAKGNPDLNYQSSIVDLMKLLDLDSSLDARKQLADELGYTGAKDGSAEMNIWLHRKVMDGLASNGGLVPESMRS